MVRVFTPQKAANATNQGFFPPGELTVKHLPTGRRPSLMPPQCQGAGVFGWALFRAGSSEMVQAEACLNLFEEREKPERGEGLA